MKPCVLQAASLSLPLVPSSHSAFCLWVWLLRILMEVESARSALLWLAMFCLLNCLQVYLCYNLLRKFLLCRNSISLHIPYGFLIRSSDRHLITSVVWLANAAQDMDVRVSALIPAFRFGGKDLQVELIDWSVCAWFFSGALICFPYKMAMLFHNSRQQWAGAPMFPHPHQCIFSIFFFTTRDLEQKA